MIQESRPQSNTIITNDDSEGNHREAGCLFALITSRRSVSRRNRASWFLRQLNKTAICDPTELIESDEPSNRSDSTTSSQNEACNDTDNSTPRLDSNAKSDSFEKDIFLVSITGRQELESSVQLNQAVATTTNSPISVHENEYDERFFVSTNTRVLYLSKSIATSIVLDLSPSIVSVNPQGDCVFLDSIFDALKRVLHLLVKHQEVPSSSKQSFILIPKVFVTVIAYTPFVVAKNNQVLIQNRSISPTNIDQVLVEIWICLNRLTQELHELVSNSYGIGLDYESTKTSDSAFVFPRSNSGNIIRHPGLVLEDIYELGLFSATLMPRLSRLSIVILSDGLFASSNNLNTFRLRSIAVSFVSLCPEAVSPDASFGYTSYSDLMRFVAKSTQGVYITHQDLIQATCSLSNAKVIPLADNPLSKLFCWTLHSNSDFLSYNCLSASMQQCQANKCVEVDTIPSASTMSSRSFNNLQNTQQQLDSTSNGEMRPELIAKFFCIDQSFDAFPPSASTDAQDDSATNENHCHREHRLKSSANYHDWRSYKQLERDLDADFEQVLSCLLREGYLIKHIHIKQRETSRIVARLVLHWKHNLDLEQELTAPYWKNQSDPFDLNDGNDLMLRPFNSPLYGDTFCEIFVHGSYSFLHNLYCDRKVKRRSEYRDVAYKQFKQLIDGILQTHERLQYLSRFYHDTTLSKVPNFLLHGNSLLYEQPHTHKLTSMVENVVDDTKTNEFQEYWQKISCLDTKSWKNLMHVHTLRLVLEHDQPKHKNINCQNASGRYTNIQCRRALSAISNFIKGYASFALLEDSTYIKFIYNKDNDLREIETSATKGFIVIQINKLLPIVVIYLMFTSGILDSHRVQIVSYLEDQLVNCKIRNARLPLTAQGENILRSKTIYPSSESCCVLIRSPLERMLKVYSRNFVGDSLAQNLTLGLPGSCPYSTSQLVSGKISGQQQHSNSHQKSRTSSIKSNYIEEYSSADDSINHYNLVFGKYLYGVRVVHKIAHLPHDLVQLLTSNVLAKISAILVNVRIKQGFHIAFNNSGILNLVVELIMQDRSNAQHTNPSLAPAHKSHCSTCLCQYMVYPPTITSRIHRPNLIYNNTTSAIHGSGLANKDDAATNGSKPTSLSESLANSDNSFVMKNPSSNLTNEISSIADVVQQSNDGEVKVIREYWIEQQYGVSTHYPKNEYHNSLTDMRYSEVVDHLFSTDTELFDCLLTYDILQLLCDKLSPFHEFDVALYQADQLIDDQQQLALAQRSAVQPDSPTTSFPSSTSSSNFQLDSDNQHHHSPSKSKTDLPSTLIEGNVRDGSTRVPLIEVEYRFSLVKFLDHCQQASLNVLLFRDRSNYYDILSQLDDNMMRADLKSKLDADGSSDIREHKQIPVKRTSRKMSIDVNMHDGQSSRIRREYRSSQDNLAYSTTPLGSSQSAAALHNSIQQQQQQLAPNPIYSPSLNHLFLETLHKRLRQMHDKELKLTRTDRRLLGAYLKRRKLTLDPVNQDPHARTAANDVVDSVTQKPHTDTGNTSEEETKSTNNDQTIISYDDDEIDEDLRRAADDGIINWRCFMRKRNQENMMIVFVPSSLRDVTQWMNLVDGTQRSEDETICPIFVFRCSSTMLNERVLSFLYNQSDPSPKSMNREHATMNVVETDLSLHFGQPCKYLGTLLTFNDELDHDILPLNRLSICSNLAQSDEKTIELVHFRAFLRKIKNTVLKSRFSSLSDAYLSELFIHKDDLLYYIRNVDSDTQKKYHVSTQLKNLSEFIRTYEDYVDSLPKEQNKTCNRLLNSILLQKCGIFINQPIVRFNESNPLMKQLQDRKLLFLMRCNYKIELPVLEETLAHSTMLKSFVHDGTTSQQAMYGSVPVSNPSVRNRPQRMLSQSHLSPKSQASHQQVESSLSPPPAPSHSPPTTIGGLPIATATSSASSSLTNQNSHDATRLMDMRYGSSMGQNNVSQSHAPTMIAGSSSILSSSSTSGFALGLGAARHALSQHHPPNRMTANHHHQRRLSASSPSASSLNYDLNRITTGLGNDSFILEAFKNVPCTIDDVSIDLKEDIECSKVDAEYAIGLKHEAHMAEVLRRKAERNESHQYRRVLKSKTNYSQSHSAIDQALRRVDSLGRLEHFCLTPLLFSPSWRSKLAPVRDHTLEDFSSASNRYTFNNQQYLTHDTFESLQAANNSNTSDEQFADERWHQTVCTNYIKEYEQYIQTLGFNSVQIRYPSTGANAQNSATNLSPQQVMKSSPSRRGSNRFSTAFGEAPLCSHSPQNSDSLQRNAKTRHNQQQSSRRESSVQSLSNISQTPPNAPVQTVVGISSNPAYNTGYLIKFLNSGCLVFKVGFCRPYVYSMLYSIEGERFSSQQQPGQSKRNDMNTSGSLKMNNMTAYLDELDNIKVTMHLHSFTYDYHLRSMYSFISGRQLIFSPGYHLISFIDDFRKYYQKAPNFARNHVLSGEIVVRDLFVNGQQLYNYIVANNASYNLDLLEMALDIKNSPVTRHHQLSSNNRHSLSATNSFNQERINSGDTLSGDADAVSRNHASDYVLIELKREKVRYKDGKDPDIFDCGLLITYSRSNACNSRKNSSSDTGQQLSNNCLTLKYFLLLTNQRDLYPKLVHSLDDIGIGYHRPIRLGTSTGCVGDKCPATSVAQTDSTVASLEVSSDLERTITASRSRLSAPPVIPSSLTTTTATTAPSDLDDAHSSNDLLLSSGELSGPPSIFSGNQEQECNRTIPSAGINASGPVKSKTATICDEEITYLGYFSSDEMDMLRFLQEKTKSLHSHIENIVRTAEIHYRRDYLWQKLMQRTPKQSALAHTYFASSSVALSNKTTIGAHETAGQLTASLKSNPNSANDLSQAPLCVDELVQLLQIVQTIDLSALDPQLATFKTMSLSWYLKLLKAFQELKQYTANSHRIYQVKAYKTLLLFIDPKCCSAFVLLSLDQDRGSAEISLLLKDQREPCAVGSSTGPDYGSKHSLDEQNNSACSIELDTDCQQLINDFVNFCAAFMWSTLVTG